MSTDTIEPTETLAETITRHLDDPDTYVFYSRASRLRLIRQGKTEMPIATGGWVQGLSSVRYDFLGGVLTVHSGQDPMPDGPGGAEQDVVEWLKRHSAFNVDFWLEGEEPGRLTPTDREVHQEITDALIERDAVKLVAVIERETATHKRKQLIEAAKDALNRLMKQQGAPAETPTAGVEPEREVFDRDAAILELMELDVEVPDDVTDAQLKAALIVSRPVTKAAPEAPAG